MQRRCDWILPHSSITRRSRQVRSTMSHMRCLFGLARKKWTEIVVSRPPPRTDVNNSNPPLCTQKPEQMWLVNTYGQSCFSRRFLGHFPLFSRNRPFSLARCLTTGRWAGITPRCGEDPPFWRDSNMNRSGQPDPINTYSIGSFISKLLSDLGAAIPCKRDLTQVQSARASMRPLRQTNAMLKGEFLEKWAKTPWYKLCCRYNGENGTQYRDKPDQSKGTRDGNTTSMENTPNTWPTTVINTTFWGLKRLKTAKCVAKPDNVSVYVT